MTTADRAAALAGVTGFPADELIGLVAAELGHPEALDRFVAHGDLHSKAVALSPILHIVAGNTPEAAIQTLTRGLLVGAKNRIKLPEEGMPEIDSLVLGLPQALRAQVELTTERNVAGQWMEDAPAVIAFGSDETIWEIEARLSPQQIFIAHGHKVSIAVIEGDPEGDAAALAARDVIAHDQRGCLSPHDVYVAEELRPRLYAERLAAELAKCERPPERSFEERAAIDHLRRGYQFRMASDTSVQTWQGDSGDWTVVFEEEQQFAASPLGRFVFVKPLPADLTCALELVRDHLSSIALHPFSLDRAEKLTALGATRICPLGKAQQPSTFWHHDGGEVLAPLVRWIDAG